MPDIRGSRRALFQSWKSGRRLSEVCAYHHQQRQQEDMGHNVGARQHEHEYGRGNENEVRE